MKQYFISKLKDQYLPKIIFDCINNGKLKRQYYEILYIDERYFRKIKILNLENRIEKEDKELLEFLLNKNFIHLLTSEEFENSYGGRYSTLGVSGSSGISGTWGITGGSGVSGTAGT